MSTQHAMKFSSSRLRERERHSGSVLYDIGVSLSDVSYYPIQSGSPPAIRKYLAEGPLNWVRRRLKNAFVILQAWGVSSDVSSNGMKRLTSVVNAADKPDWCFVQLAGDPESITDFAGLDASCEQFAILTRNICGTLSQNGIRPILALLPMQALWQPKLYRYTAAVRNKAWLQDFAKKNGIPLLNECAPTARPEAQQVSLCTSLSRTSNVVTAVITGSSAAGWVTGDWIAQGGTVDAGFVLSTTVQITMTGTDTMTYAHTGSNGSATNKGIWARGESITDLTKDGTHRSPKGASKVALIWEPILDSLFPQVDDLSDTESDYFNLCGSGVAGVADHTAMNRGMMVGIAGTRTGTAVAHTGDGALAGGAAQAFANTATLTADGALAGSADLVFALSGTLELPAGAISGTAVLAFSNSGTLLGEGALVGIAPLAFALGGTLTPPPSPDVGIAAPVGHPVYYRVKRRKSLNELIGEIVDLSAREMYEDLTELAPTEAAKIVKPYAETKATVPSPAKIDWAALERETARVQALIDLWKREAFEQLLREEDEEILLLM